MSDTNVGLGMAPHRKGCRCDECQLELLNSYVLLRRSNHENASALEDARNKVAELEAENEKMRLAILAHQSYTDRFLEGSVISLPHLRHDAALYAALTEEQTDE